jgi:hypothetical protein
VEGGQRHGRRHRRQAIGPGWRRGRRLIERRRAAGEDLVEDPIEDGQLGGVGDERDARTPVEIGHRHGRAKRGRVSGIGRVRECRIHQRHRLGEPGAAIRTDDQPFGAEPVGETRGQIGEIDASHG